MRKDHFCIRTVLHLRNECFGGFTLSEFHFAGFVSKLERSLIQLNLELPIADLNIDILNHLVFTDLVDQRELISESARNF